MRRTTSQTMLVACVVAGLWAASAARLLADDKTVTGEAMCIKDHQTAIKVREGDKAVTYFVVENDLSKDFHRKICAKPAKVKARGDVKETNGKLELTATELELVKDY